MLEEVSKRNFANHILAYLETSLFVCSVDPVRTIIEIRQVNWTSFVLGLSFNCTYCNRIPVIQRNDFSTTGFGDCCMWDRPFLINH